jgi:hypothetical protein
MKKVSATPNQEYTKQYPRRMSAKIAIRLQDGTTFRHKVQHYSGRVSHRFTWEGREIRPACRRAYRRCPHQADQSRIVPADGVLIDRHRRPVVLLVDLEDAVAARDKSAARTTALNYPAGPRPGTLRTLRANGLDTRAGISDIDALIGSAASPDFPILPKTETATCKSPNADVLEHRFAHAADVERPGAPF